MEQIIKINIPEGFELRESTKDGVKTFDVIAKTIAKSPEKIFREISRSEMLGKHCYYINTSGNISRLSVKDVNGPLNLYLANHATKDRADAFLYLQALVTARDYYNEQDPSLWGTVKYCFNNSKVFEFKTREVRDQFLEDFGEWIEKCKELI